MNSEHDEEKNIPEELLEDDESERVETAFEELHNLKNQNPFLGKGIPHSQKPVRTTKRIKFINRNIVDGVEKTDDNDGDDTLKALLKAKKDMANTNSKNHIPSAPRSMATPVMSGAFPSGAGGRRAGAARQAYINSQATQQHEEVEAEENVEESEQDQIANEAGENNSSEPQTNNSNSNNNNNGNNKEDKKKKNSKKKKKNPKKKKNILVEFIKKYPWVFIIICFIILIILFILAIAASTLSGSGGKSPDTYLDPKYDYNRSVVLSINPSDDTEVFEEVLLDDFAKGATYAALYDKVSDLTDNEKLSLYMTYLIAIKSKALDLGNYNAEDKELTIKSGTGGIAYCDIYNGCNVYKNGSTETYVSSIYTQTPSGTLSESIPVIPDSEKKILDLAFDSTEYQILTEGKVEEAITEYPYSIPDITETIIDNWIVNIKNGKGSLQIIQATPGFNNLEIYDIQDYAPQLISPSNGMYWWPIGSAEADENGLYSGEPTATTITAHFAGNDSVHKGKHGATDIGAAINKHVIIAARSGTVKVVKEGCDTVGGLGNKCNGGGGNYVIITHDDGAETTYMHMAKGSIVVKVGDYVLQGQKLGMSGSSGNSTGGHLHFALKIDGSPVDPEEYISAENPRQSIGVNIQYVQGSTTKETVCKTLKASNFNTNAVAALMANIQAESSFNIGAEGDHGTSYGLCQWHNGRKSRLKEYCGSNYNTAECQLDYLMHELKNSYKDVYQNLIADGTSWNMANYFCVNFERPAKTKITCTNRANQWVSTFDSYVQNNCKEVG